MPLTFRREIFYGGTAIGFYYRSASGVISGRDVYPSFGTFASVADMVDIYTQYFRDKFKRSNTTCGIGCSVNGTNEELDLKTDTLVYTVPNGHQRRFHDIAFNDLNAAQAIIDSIPLSSYPKFFDGPDGLYEFVKKAIDHIKHIGPLTLYDTAIRIGQNLTPKVEPKDFVYIPASGPHDGATKFLKTYAGLSAPPIISGPNRIAIGHFAILTGAPYFLTPLEIEDMLCVFHKHI